MLDTPSLLHGTYPIISSPWPGLWQVLTHTLHYLMFRYVAEHSRANIMVVEDDEQYAKVTEI